MELSESLSYSRLSLLANVCGPFRTRCFRSILTESAIVWQTATVTLQTKADERILGYGEPLPLSACGGTHVASRA